MATSDSAYEWEIPDSWGTAQRVLRARTVLEFERAGTRAPSGGAHGCPSCLCIFPEAVPGASTQDTGRRLCAGTRSRSSTALPT
jgi:hypothetical protein